MSSLARLTVASLVLTFCFLIPTEARADAFTFVIIGGNVNNENHTTSSTTIYDFSSPEFFVHGGGIDTSTLSVLGCTPCTSSTPLSAGGILAARAGGVILNGTIITPLFFRGSLNVTGPAFTLPDAPPAAPGLFSITLPFEMSGTLDGDASYPSGPPNIIFTTTLTGQGLVTFRFFVQNLNGHALYSYQDATYNFLPANIPEPATIMLLGTGLAGVVAKMRRRRRVSH